MRPLARHSELHLWIAVGQSNVVGTNVNGTILTDLTLDDQILFWDYSGSFSPPTPPAYVSNGWADFKSHAGGYGPERGFMRRYAKFVPNVTHGVIKVAFNGLGLQNFISTNTSGVYAELVSQVNAALAAASAAGWSPKIVGHFCLGHTANANSETPQATYEEYLEQQLQDYAGQWGDPDEWLVALADHPASWTTFTEGAPAIRAAIAAFSADRPNQVVVASTADTNHVGDQVHYTSASKELVGVRMANLILDL